jgi:hypothetical protein
MNIAIVCVLVVVGGEHTENNGLPVSEFIIVVNP